MYYNYGMGGESVEAVLGMFAVLGVYTLILLAFSIACYVLRSVGVYSIAKRRGINHPWMAWVPVVDHYLLGCISDQYRYVAKGENKSKRKALLTLSIIFWAAYIAFFAMYIPFVIQIAVAGVNGYSEAAILQSIMGMAVGVLFLALVMLGVGLAMMIVRFIALYDLYASCDPGNKVLYLVMSILFSVTEPFFIFFNRKKDGGMPPRRDTTMSQQIPVRTEQDPWEQNQEQ